MKFSISNKLLIAIILGLILNLCIRCSSTENKSELKNLLKNKSKVTNQAKSSSKEDFLSYFSGIDLGDNEYRERKKHHSFKFKSTSGQATTTTATPTAGATTPAAGATTPTAGATTPAAGATTPATGTTPTTGGAASNTQANNSTNSSEDIMKVLEKFPDDGTLLETWMSISTSQFENIQRYPPITLPDGNVTKIKFDHMNFRLNFAVNCTDPARPWDERDFYFRMDSDRIYYSATKTDINVLGSMLIHHIVHIKDSVDITGGHELYCFEISNDGGEDPNGGSPDPEKWKVCNKDKDISLKWECRIRGWRHLPSSRCYGHADLPPDVIVRERKIRKPIVLIPLPSPFCNQDWNYDKNGDDWVCDCSEGKEQSPIDLPKIEDSIDSPVVPIFQYSKVSHISNVETIDGVLLKQKKLKIENKNHYLSIKSNEFGHILTLDGAKYKAEEISFHTPANHQIDGKTYEMEMTIIHYGITKGDIGKQVTLSFVFEKAPGVYNRFIDDVDFFNLPNPISKESELAKDLYIPKIFYNQDEVGTDSKTVEIMKPFSMYTYQGSLPFPPCTEQTIVYVASQPIQLSSTAMMMFKEAARVPDLMNVATHDVIVSDRLPVSNRNIQERNGRPVYHFDHQKYCGPDIPGQHIKPTGHYEKIKQKATQYFYVNGPKPSGIPGAFVVSEKEAKGIRENLEQI